MPILASLKTKFKKNVFVLHYCSLGSDIRDPRFLEQKNKRKINNNKLKHMIWGAFLAGTIVHDQAGGSKKCRMHGRGRCSSTRRGIRTSAPVSGPGATRLQPAGSRGPEPEASRTGAESSRNPESGTRSQQPGTILHMCQEINVSHSFNVIIRKNNKDFIY